MTGDAHEYAAHLIWDGDTGDGTATYAGYGRQYRVLVAGKPVLAGSADAAFRGDAGKHNPEDLFLAAISACHMLSYLALCARKRICVLTYEDDTRGTMVTDARGGGKFTEVVLRPRVTIRDATQLELATQLHESAHELCFIANSCSVPIRHDATVRSA
jgi:organic hydroperoxide reductase OsmC/OhrA